MNRSQLQMAVVGAGPVGLALALQAARVMPWAHITVFDARAAERDVAGDGRTLALSLGSVQLLQRLMPWPPQAQAITEVHVSQQPPSFGRAEVRLRAAEQGLPLLGAVLAYGQLLAPLQQAWLDAVAAEPQRLQMRFASPVAALKNVCAGVEVDSGTAEVFDLAVLAEGGVFGQQAHKPIVRDYRQTAWVGQVTHEGASLGMAFERFTRHGPAALLPLAPGRSALVWCVERDGDPVQPLDDTQRLALLNTIFPPAAGHLLQLSALKAFALGLNAERTLVQGRTVRIGNAAQTLHPVAGQGLNLGLRDAYELAAALRLAGDVDDALKRVEWARAADRWATIASTDFLARSFTWQWPGLALARGLGLAGLQALPPLKGWLARRMMFGTR